jgi:para-nitrobenzyl esterase
LNIWTPDLGEANLPVMVFIHGGAFTNGSGSRPTFDGTNFARSGVVCVTFNYRLGPEGFLYLTDGVPNLALLDQIAALQWVQDHIARFGGDPDNVTIFGESAGAWSVATLTAMPMAHGLFKRVCPMSGAAHHALSAEAARNIAKHIAAKFGVEPTVASMSKISVQQLVEIQQAVSDDMRSKPDAALWGTAVADGFTFPYLPAIDGEQLPGLPIDVLAAGKGAKVDLLIGCNTDESHLFLVPTGLYHFIDDNFVKQKIADYGLPVDDALAVYGAARPGEKPYQLASAVLTDRLFRIPAIRMAEAHVHSNAGKTFMYDFAWGSEAFDGMIGACHAMQLPFVFDNLHIPGVEGLRGKTPPQSLADSMHAAWISFAKTGDPGWPAYDLSRRATMRFDAVSDVVDDPRAAERLLWEGRR